MKMDKMFAGLVAFVAGVALSAGSAFAQTNGYVVGDSANMKLVPYYETGDNKATIIGIQNMSPQEMVTQSANTAVATAKKNLADEEAKASPSLDKVADLKKALETAEKAAYTEHMFVTVNVYDAMGMMMDDASATLCLAENQFGVVVLQGVASMGGDGHMMQTLSVADGDISAYGYVEVSAGTKKYNGCTATTPDGLTRVDTNGDSEGFGDTTNEVAAWTIIQDTGDGFFGTEVPTATISMERAPGAAASVTTDDGDPEVACYSTPDKDDALVDNGSARYTSGVFMMERCGLIPERYNNTRTEGENAGNPMAGTATPRATAYARYDAGDESMVYVWLAAGGDTDKTKPSKRRTLDVTVTCEDGSMQQASDIDGNMGPVKVAAPGMLTMIDPSMGDLGTATDMCEGDRGVLNITMPGKSRAGMVFTHITQMMGHYRMNFPGYGNASGTACTTANLTKDDDAYKAECAD